MDIDRLPDWIQWILVILIILSITFGIAFLTEDEIKYPEIKCNHPTEKQIISKYVSYQIFVDSMYSAKKRDIKRFTDSLTKYRIK